MKNKLLIVADLGLLKAYKLDYTPNHTPRLEHLEGGSSVAASATPNSAHQVNRSK
jgi:hypothetical protein